MSRLQAAARGVWDFVVGDDWLVSVQIAIAVAATAAIAATGTTAWWVLPPAVIITLYVSLRRAT